MALDRLPHPAIVCEGTQLLEVIEGLESGTYPQPEDAIWREDLPRELAVRLAKATGATGEQIAEITSQPAVSEVPAPEPEQEQEQEAPGQPGAEEADLIIRHTHEDGTLLEGSTKGDGVYEILRGLRDNWRYFPSIRRIGLGSSRDRNASTWKIERAAKALREAGHEVTVEVDETQRRTVAEIETDRAERAADRADRYEDRSERTGAQAAADYARARQMSEAIPFGQPVMPDHHSYGRDMSYRRRMGRTYERAFAGMDEAERLSDRADAARANQAHRESIPATLRRIEKMEADLRGVRRDLAGRMDYVPDGNGGYDLKLVKPQGGYKERLEQCAADLDEQLAYWREHVATAESEGVKVWRPADFKKGDFVGSHGTWAEVLRVNPKSLTIAWGTNFTSLTVITRENSRNALGEQGWTSTMPYDKVRERKTAREIAPLLAAQEAKPEGRQE